MLAIGRGCGTGAARRELGLTAEDDFVLRVVQLSELLAIRHCVFLMGPTGSGRTEVYRVRHALRALATVLLSCLAAAMWAACSIVQ